MHDHLLDGDLEHGEDNKTEELEENRVRELESGLSGIVSVTDCRDDCADPVDGEDVHSVLAVAVEIFYCHLEWRVSFLIIDKVIATDPDPHDGQVVNQHEDPADRLGGVDDDIKESLVFIRVANLNKKLEWVVQEPDLVETYQFERHELGVQSAYNLRQRRYDVKDQS